MTALACGLVPASDSTGAKRKLPREPTRPRTRSDARICPASARRHRRRAPSTAVENTSASSRMGSPTCSATRTARGVAPGRRLAEQLPAGKRRGRLGARPLFGHRAGAGPDLALPRRPRRDQPPRPGRAACLRAGRRADALDSLRAAHRRDPDAAAGRAAADRGRAVRLSRLRHGPADGAAAGDERRMCSAFRMRCWCGRR